MHEIECIKMCIKHYGNIYEVLYKQPSSKVLPEIRFQFFNLVQAEKSGKDVAAYAQLEMYKE